MKRDTARIQRKVIPPGTRTDKKKAAQAKRWEIKDSILKKLQEFAHEGAVNQAKDAKVTFEKTDEWLNDWIKREPQLAQIIKQEAIMVVAEMRNKLKERTKYVSTSTTTVVVQSPMEDADSH